MKKFFWADKKETMKKSNWKGVFFLNNQVNKMEDSKKKKQKNRDEKEEEKNNEETEKKEVLQIFFWRWSFFQR